MSTAETGNVGESRGRFFSIGWKLAGTTVAVVAVLAICVFVALRHYEKRNLLASKEAAATMVARLYVATAVAPLTFADDKGVQEVVGLLAANGDIVHASAWSIGPGGTSLGERLGELRNGDTVPPPEHVPRALEVHQTDANVVVEAPVFDPTNKLVGVVQAAFSLAPEHEALAATERRTLATSMGTAALLSAILLFLARRVIVRPIARLALAAQALERGDAPQIRRTANDEIGALATAFVSMSEAIKQREKRIAERNADLRAVLDNVEEGFLGVTPRGVISPERSRIVDEWFGPPKEGATFFDYMEVVAGTRFGEWLRLGWEFATDGIMPVDVAVAQLPQRFERGARSYAVKYRPILAGEDIAAMIVVIQDVTERVARERAEEAQREMMVVFTHVMEGRAAFEEFFTDTERLLASIEQKSTAADRSDGDADLLRDLHTLKGNAATFALDTIARRCHDLEGSIAEDKQRPSASDLALLRAEWGAIATTYRRFSGSKTTAVTLDEQDQEELLRVVGAGGDVKTVAALARSWRDERATTRMQAIGDQVTRLAARLGKGDVKVEIAPSTLRLPALRWGPFWSVFGHVVRNAVDHGFEGGERRRERGKPEESRVRMSLETEPGGIVFRFADDGAGIDWERVAAKAKERGLPATTPEDLTRALFVDSLSTRDEASLTSGRGVGLAAVLACVTREGGSVEVLSVRGEGTTFVFHFPRVGV